MDTSKWTAKELYQGAYSAIRLAARHAFGGDRLEVLRDLKEAYGSVYVWQAWRSFYLRNVRDDVGKTYRSFKSADLPF